MRCAKCGTDASVGEIAIWNCQRWYWVRDSIECWSSFWQTWERQPQVIWDHPDWKIEACDVYCQSCWKVWGQHVKPGCKYALSSLCEEWAIRAGIQYIDEPIHNGNPFYCQPCNAYFNHGGASLPKHLNNFHSDVGPSQRKRKLDTLTNGDHVEPVIYVSGCQCRWLSGTINGKYITKRWHHGKPVYEKDQQEEVIIYFWDGRDGEKFHGWWFSPREGSRQVWAYNSSNLAEDELTVPISGWKYPWDEEADETLKVTTGETTATDQHSDTEFDLRWEFVASEDGEKEDWQPMKKDMNDALEKRWADGWAGDSATGTFYLESNGFTYGIDCPNMVQWNVRTHRRRRIRRGEARPDPLAALSKLAEKDAQMERLQNEKEKLMDERDKLSAKVRKLKQKNRTLQNSQADHAAQMILQEAWRMNQQLQTKVCTELDRFDAAFSNIQEALREACPFDHFGDCSRMKNVSITGLQQVRNPGLWKCYEFRKDQVRKELEGRDSVPAVNNGLPLRVCNWAHLDAKTNEILVIHGTTNDKIDQIANFGFDERLASSKGLYGRGVYFTDQSCKSLQYSGADSQSSGCFILARVILGHPHHAQGPLQKLKVEPWVDESNQSKGRCHSVIAKPGTPAGQQRQVHREFVIFNGAQAYPEMIVHFQVS